MKYIILLLFMLCSCSGPKTIAIEDKFTDTEVELIEEAIFEWVEASNSNSATIFTLTGFKNEDGFTIDDWKKERDFGVLFKVNSTDKGYKQLVAERDSDGFKGLANEDSGNIIIVVDKISSEEQFYRVVLHEIGHIHGLEHFNGGVMEPGTDKICVASVDLEEFCDDNHCGPAAYPTCE